MQILQQLSEAIGVSGAETEVRKLIVDLVQPHVDDLKIDRMGNVLALKRGTGMERPMTVMLDAHMDEVGLMVTGYDSNGMLKVAAVGGLDDRILSGKRVLVGPKKIPGVIGTKPHHLLSGSERDNVVSIDSIRVDIGAKSKEAAEGKVDLGVRIAFDSRFIDLGETVRGKAFDNRAGCAMLIHLLQGNPYPFDLWGTFTVMEEISKAGARVAANTVCPDLAFVVDATFAVDLPRDDEEADVSPTTEMGKGPSLSVMDRSSIYDTRLNALLMHTADDLGIPYQIKQPNVGGTNASEIIRAFGGVPVAVIQTPCRYIHTPAALLRKSDYDHAVRLLDETLRRLDWSVLQR